VTRLRALIGRLGLYGVLGVGVLLFCVPLYWTALRPLERELAAARLASAQTRLPAGLRAVSLDARTDDLKRFYELFPHVGRLADELDRVYGLAREAGLRLEQGEYRIEKRASGLVAYRVALPVRGRYVQVRDFLGVLLMQMPVASVDALRFERKKSGDSLIDAQIRLTIHFQPSGDAP
jgi:hypothetical protein